MSKDVRNQKALFDYCKSIDFLFQITDDEVCSAHGQCTFAFDSDYIQGNYQSFRSMQDENATVEEK